MRFGVKLIVGSILALVLGVSSTAPLLFSMFGITEAEIGPKTQFDVDVLYAYIVAGNSSTPMVLDDSNITTKEVSGVWHSFVFNFTHNSEARYELSDAKISVYLIEVYSDKGYIGNKRIFTGTNYNNSYKLQGRFFDPDQLFDGEISGGGSFYYNWTTNESKLQGQGGGGTTWVPTFGQPETISVSIRLYGWVEYYGDSSVVTLASGEEITQVQLEKFGDGFLYNTIIPEDQLSQIDPLNPFEILLG